MTCPRCLSDVGHPGPCVSGCPVCGGDPGPAANDGTFVSVSCSRCGTLLERAVIVGVQRIGRTA